MARASGLLVQRRVGLLELPDLKLALRQRRLELAELLAGRCRARWRFRSTRRSKVRISSARAISVWRASSSRFSVRLARACSASNREFCRFISSRCLWLASSSAADSRARSACASARPVSTALSRPCVSGQRLVGFAQAARGLRSSPSALSSEACTAARSWSACIAFCWAACAWPSSCDRALVGSGDALAEPAVLLAASVAAPSPAAGRGAAVRRCGCGARSARRPARPWSVRARPRFAAPPRRCRAAARLRLRGAAAFFSAAVEFVAQLVIGDARGVERALQAELFALGLLVGAQRLADRIDQLADRALDDLELADLVLGVEQQIADRFVLLAKLRRDRENSSWSSSMSAFSGAPRVAVRAVARLRASRPRTRVCGRER